MLSPHISSARMFWSPLIPIWQTSRKWCDAKADLYCNERNSCSLDLPLSEGNSLQRLEASSTRVSDARNSPHRYAPHAEKQHRRLTKHDQPEPSGFVDITSSESLVFSCQLPWAVCMADTVKHLIMTFSNEAALLIGRLAASREIGAGDCLQFGCSQK